MTTVSLRESPNDKKEAIEISFWPKNGHFFASEAFSQPPRVVVVAVFCQQRNEALMHFKSRPKCANDERKCLVLHQGSKKGKSKRTIESEKVKRERENEKEREPIWGGGTKSWKHQMSQSALEQAILN